ncbi:signal peptide-containing protein [Theileria equi strain WA]|uniref:Signal peptide-containing protein n=1 Tax=Theileria equi strain WA TaxID=1537102 RepID=L0AZ43_THEEQ|nr:signal peptide-containing protein [Theileria equi strain WA]AFZ80830.1 signal peptide-containing protein [Theileria equi strain WA]|eukprot:XP_004830496.1 signal peptide-containing protein [Theileria equi strain WA]
MRCVALVYMTFLFKLASCNGEDDKVRKLQRELGETDCKEIAELQALLDDKTEEELNLMFCAVPEEDVEFIREIFSEIDLQEDEDQDATDYGSKPGILEITRLNREHFSQYETDYRGVFHTTYFPKSTRALFSVLEYGKAVWTAEDGEECRVVEVHCTDEYLMIVLHLYKHGKLYFKHLLKVKEKWIEISLGEFFVRLNRSMNKTGNLKTNGPVPSEEEIVSRL